MFHGSIPQDMRSIVHEITKTWQTSDIYIGCSGNFTVERVLASIGKHRIHSNDVTIYSYAIGDYLAGGDADIRLKPEHKQFDWLTEYMQSPADRVATLMLGTRLAEGIGKDGAVKDNRYYQRLYPAFQQQWGEMHAKTRAKLDPMPITLASYHNGDVVPWTIDLPKDAGFISYPPFFSGDYESMFSKLDLLFDWQKPDYEEIGDGHVESFLEAITNRPYWIFGVNHQRPEYDAYLRGMTKTTNRGMPIYVYASVGNMRVVTPHQKTESVTIPRLLPDEIINKDSKLQITPIKYTHFQALRSQYMNIYIKPGQAGQAFAVLVDGKLVGVFALNQAASYGDADTLYMLSDFAVAPSRYSRLSKLVLYAALSSEAKLYAERMSRRRIRKLLTTAFSNNPVSMKYRGLFDVFNRKENKNWSPDDTAHDQQRYQINYIAPLGQWTLQEGLAQWHKKHSKK